MAASTGAYRLQGPFNVAFRKDKQSKEWHALALEFNLLGTGPTKNEALEDLQSIFFSYLCAVLDTRGRVQFHCPADPEDYDNAEEFAGFNVVVKYTRDALPSFVDVDTELPTATFKSLKRKTHRPRALSLVR